MQPESFKGQVSARYEAQEAAERGIPPQRLAALFEKFNQGDASTTRRFGGTGLGLAISQELTALMGGQLAVDSVEGQGSTFTVTLPMRWRAPALTAPLPTPAVQARAVESGARVRILAAEDNPTNQLVLRAMLEPFDVDLTLAADGREAVEFCAAARFMSNTATLAPAAPKRRQVAPPMPPPPPVTMTV